MENRTSDGVGGCRGAIPGYSASRSEVFVENLIANFIENGRKSIKFTIKFTAKLAKKALLGQALS